MHIQTHHIWRKDDNWCMFESKKFLKFMVTVYIPNNFDFSPIKYQDLSCPDAQYPVTYSFKSFFVWKVQLLQMLSSHTLTRGHWIQILLTAKKLFLNIRHKKMNLILVWIKKEKKQSIGNLVRSVPIILPFIFCYCAKVFGQIKSDVKFTEQKSQILTWQ